MFSLTTRWPVTVPAIAILLSASGVFGAADQNEDLLSGHPRFSYENVKDVDAMEAALRKSLAGQETYSFSRGWWQWDRLRCRYVDGERKDRNALKILRAVFRGLILDRHAVLQAKGEGDLMYIYFTTLRGGKREEVLEIDGRQMLRDVHGGGTHGGWGGAARMRIYEELAKHGMLTQDEKGRFREIVHQSFKRRFIDFNTGYQHADNHAFGNVGGIAIALRLFPDVPQANEAQAWMERVWKEFSDFGDWKEWTYYPYGPIFLHGMMDLAEERGAFETQRDLLYAVGRRCLGFVHGGGVRGNPNAYAPATNEKERLDAVYENPWQTCYYQVEQTARDGHFWYRMAKHFKDPEFLWAAEQIVLGGRPPDGNVPPEYVEAYNRRFAWFNQRDIRPRIPAGKSAVGYLSPLKHRIPERLYVCPGRESGKPFASFFVYDGTGSHLNPPEVWGTLYEYCIDGAKLLGSAGKYTDDIPGGSGAYDSLMITKRGLQFPIDADGSVRSGRLARDALRAENRGEDSFGQYAFSDYFGEGSRWTRQAVLTEEGYLVVRDVYQSGKATDGYQVGPCWQCKGEGEPPTHPPDQNWFDAPAWDHAWWQKQKKRVLVSVHAAGVQSYRVARHPTSADISRSIPTDGFAAAATVEAGEPKVFLTALVPHDVTEKAEAVVARIKTRMDKSGNCTATIGGVNVSINADGTWNIARSAEEAQEVELEKNLGLQLAENPPMRVISKTPPPPAPITDSFQIRDGFTLIETLDEFRAAIKRDHQRIRMKPGIYRAEKVDPPLMAPIPRTKSDENGNLPKNEQEHIFAVVGSNNHFDLRGVVFETPVSVQSKLSGKAHVADTWHINGVGNTFEGGYFRNVVDRPYPDYRVTENEFEVCNDDNTFLDCTFVIAGSVPYGYTDYYGKGGPNFGRLNKHSFMSIYRADNTRLIGCRVYMQSFGHCVHLHQADGVLIKDCYFTGTLRPTNDIFNEKVGRAKEYDFNIMYRGKQPIPRDQMIPLTEDGVRSYGGDKNIKVIDTTVERLRGCFQLLCVGDVTLQNVTVLEAGDFSYDLSSGDQGKVVMKNCRADVAYNPLFNLTRGAVPKDAFFEVTILSPAEDVQPTARTSLGTICGDHCTFILHDGTTRPLPEEVNRLHCGSKKDLADSSVSNYTTAKLVLGERVRNCVIKSVGPVEDHGSDNTVIKIKPAAND